MKPKKISFFRKYFDPSLDLRVQAFHLLAFVGIASGVITTLFALPTNAGIFTIILNISGSFVGLGCFLFARRTNRYHVGFVVAAVLTFLLIFPLLFFSSGGYRGGMPCFFIFAFVFTAIMLEGAIRKTFLALEFALYSACYTVAYINPHFVNHFGTELDFMLDSLIMGVIVVGLMLVIVMVLYVRIYDNRQKQLEELDKLKTEFYQNMHHEMKTPLNIINTDIQNADDMLEHDIDKSAVQKKLESAQKEIIRLARLVENSLDLAAAQVKQKHMEQIDFAALLREKTELFRSILRNNGNTLTQRIPDDLPEIAGNADMLSQVIFNLMYNAHRHTKNGEIDVSLEHIGNRLTAKICDTGEGIDPELLQYVFERGISSGGTGYGLSICKANIEMHGGTIAVESKPGEGTAVAFSLPLAYVVEQNGGDR